MLQGLLVKRDLMLFPVELKLCGFLWSRDVVYVGVCAGVLGDGPTALGLRHTCPRKEAPVEHSGVGLVVRAQASTVGAVLLPDFGPC